MWSHAEIICTGETYKAVVKMTFAKGASLEDPSGLFNSSLEGNTRRAIDFHEGDKIDEKALKALIRAAVALNTSGERPLAPCAPEETKERLRTRRPAGPSVPDRPLSSAASSRGLLGRPSSQAPRHRLRAAEVSVTTRTTLSSH